MAEVVEHRCLVCKSTRGAVRDGCQVWLTYQVPSGRAGPFCTKRCMESFNEWPLERQLEAIYGKAETGQQYLSALDKGTCLPDSPLLYPTQIEGQGELLIGPGETYLIGWAGGTFGGESFPVFQSTPYEVPA